MTESRVVAAHNVPTISEEAAFAIAVGLLVLGIAVIWKARAIHEWNIDWAHWVKDKVGFWPFMRLTEDPTSMWFTRIWGAIAILMGLFLIFPLFRS